MLNIDWSTVITLVAGFAVGGAITPTLGHMIQYFASKYFPVTMKTKSLGGTQTVRMDDDTLERFARVVVVTAKVAERAATEREERLKWR